MHHEFKNLSIDRSLGLGINTEEIAFKDKVREKKRQTELAQWKAAKAERAADPEAYQREKTLKKRRNEAWSDKLGREEVRVARRDKKRRRKERPRRPAI